MLHVFAGAGHGQNAKCNHLYLEMMDRHSILNKPVIDLFKVQGLYTVRYNNFQWAGIWTDLSIEQMPMRACKTSGGLTGGKLRNQKSAHKVWTSTLNHFSSINTHFNDTEEMKKKKTEKRVVHADLTDGVMKKDFAAFGRALDWFKIRTLALIKKEMSCYHSLRDLSAKLVTIMPIPKRLSMLVRQFMIFLMGSVS